MKKIIQKIYLSYGTMNVNKQNTTGARKFETSLYTSNHMSNLHKAQNCKNFHYSIMYIGYMSWMYVVSEQTNLYT